MSHPCRRVLVVEDDADLRDAIAEFLRAEGIDAGVATNGAEALQTLRAGPPPDIVLLDLAIPEVSGVDLLRQMRNDPRWKEIPVAVMSGFERNRFEYSLPANDFIEKPFDLERLNEALSRLCREAKTGTAP